MAKKKLRKMKIHNSGCIFLIYLVKTKKGQISSRFMRFFALYTFVRIILSICLKKKCLKSLNCIYSVSSICKLLWYIKTLRVCVCSIKFCKYFAFFIFAGSGFSDNHKIQLHGYQRGKEIFWLRLRHMLYIFTFISDSYTFK